MNDYMKKHGAKIGLTFLTLIIIAGAVLSFPKILNWTIEQEQGPVTKDASQDFPVTVDPKNKLITEDEEVNAYLATNHSLLGASVIDAGKFIWDIFENIAISIANIPWYQSLASVGSVDSVESRFVTIKAGMRKEQVATAFGEALAWNNKQRKALTGTSSEGLFAPGIYSVSSEMTPDEVRAMIGERFSKDVLSRYGTSTQDIVPLKDALIIASLVQRETISTDGMRLISGIIWNRLFAGMSLQIDSTLQYVKANSTTEGSWWPNVMSADKYLKSPYNTYIHKGLPPSPIANPSVAAILAALNPVKTPCLFYFNDKTGAFHCSVTYAEHVRLLKEYYGG